MIKRLIQEALADLHAAALNHGAAGLSHFGEHTRSVRTQARKRLEAAARQYFLTLMTEADSSHIDISPGSDLGSK